MSNTKTVWIVETGEYSDYCVVAVCSSQENAQLVADALNASKEDYDSEATIAERPLDPAVDEIRQGRSRYFLEMQRDGTTTYVETRIDVERLVGDEFVLKKMYPGLGKPPADRLHVSVWAKDEAHAVKIANERRIQLIASGEWDAQVTVEK